ncbi:uncharacterized protein PV06_00744 [Exophiala oligosperma]|uniref:Flavodoxin-like domain-containing protein n=2 Tax=Chaetothyriales TaxID=34395 RepID=A0A0D2E009_9EURO|nr:uncharacterized protein PV06_00744 [Exophiala oligosperma]KAJ9618591.1 hypothetical protein H2204_012944 [Knufia peltigerae]KIW48125.1 hypothetical protein PV06_00744 [Exophiala oligosperma]
MSEPDPMPVLITYATSRGSTEEVAERIASRLHADGFAVDCRPVDHVYSVDNYKAVIIGSAIHHARWLLDAERFLDVECMGLQTKPLWSFSLGSASAGTPGWIRGKVAKREQRRVERMIISKVPKVREHRLFAGKDDGRAWSSPVRGMYRCMGGRFGDFRDWDAIDKWADAIAKEMKAEGV